MNRRRFLTLAGEVAGAVTGALTGRLASAAPALLAGAPTSALSSGAGCTGLGTDPVIAPVNAGDGTLEPGLHARARAKGLFYGAAVQRRFLEQEPDFARRYAAECGVCVPELAFRWNRAHSDPERYDFAEADWLAVYARRRGMLLRGHVLVYDKDLPAWARGPRRRNDAEAMVRAHVRALTRRYAGRMHSWDVVNEIIETYDGRPDALKKTWLLDRLGPEYVPLAFEAAAAADPHALLCWNENQLEYAVPYQERRREAVLRLLQRYRAAGVPIHVLGIQAHLRFHVSPFDPQRFRAFLAEVARLGVRIIISELDVSDGDLPKDPGVRDRLVADTYAEFLPVALDEPAVLGVVTWGFADRHTWLDGFRPRRDGGRARPLPFDADLNPKAAWHAIARAFDGAPRRSASGAARRRA